MLNYPLEHLDGMEDYLKGSLCTAILTDYVSWYAGEGVRGKIKLSFNSTTYQMSKQWYSAYEHVFMLSKLIS